MKQNCVVIIDGFSSGKYFAPRLRAKNYHVVHVQSSPDCNPYYLSAFDSSPYHQSVVFNGNITDLTDLLSPFTVTAVITGTDTGIALTDELSVALGIPNNGLLLSQARRDKYLMAEQLKASGLPHIPYYFSAQPDDVIQWVEQEDCWPVVVKPAISGGSEGLAVCSNSSELRKACSEIIGHASTLGHRHQHVLCQPFIQGVEYAVNAISCNGQHYVCDMWQYRKTHKNGTMLYNSMEMIPSQGKVQSQLIAYALTVMDVLGLKQGPSHLEMFMTEKGPLLVELNARLMGVNMAPSLLDAALGKGNNVVDLIIDRYIQPEQFLKKIKATPVCQLKQPLIIMLFIVAKDGMSLNEANLQKIKQLPSCIDVVLKDRFVKTADLFTAPGWAVLSHADPEQYAKDVATAEHLQKNLFV